MKTTSNLSYSERARLRQARDQAVEYHPLDGAPPPRTVPDQWYPEFVGFRLIEAFEVLGRQPLWGGGGGTCWPAYLQDKPSVEEFLERRDNWGGKIRPERPTSDEIALCDEALGWPIKYLGDDTERARVVGLWALWRAIGWDVQATAERRGWSWSTFKRHRSTGLLVIAVGLIGDKVEVM